MKTAKKQYNRVHIKAHMCNLSMEESDKKRKGTWVVQNQVQGGI